MWSVTKYRDTLLFVSCSAVLVGTVLALQKLTTPSHHRRRAASSASRAGTGTRSAHRGFAGARSRSSSHPRGKHVANPSRNADVAAAAAGNSVNYTASAVTAVGTDRTHAGKGRETAQAHVTRHHTHAHHVAGDSAALSNDTAGTASSRPLTVDAVIQHKKILGTANVLQNPGFHESSTCQGARRSGTGTGGRMPGGSGSGDEGVYNYRTASNAATVGSQAPQPAPPHHPALQLTGAEETRPLKETEAFGASPAQGVALDSAPTRTSSIFVGGTADAAVKDAGAIAPQHSPQRGCLLAFSGNPATLTAADSQKGGSVCRENRGTQTGMILQSSAPKETSESPDRWIEAMMMMSPIVPREDEHANNSPSLNRTDMGWSPLLGVRDTPHKNTVEGPREQCVQERERDLAKAAIPSFFLEPVEEQVRLLVNDVSQDAWNDRAWMTLYMYLSELPAAARGALASRNQCLATRVARLVKEEEASPSLVGGNVVEDTLMQAEKAANVDAAPTLHREVFNLLQDGKPFNDQFHFEWCGPRVQYTEGSFRATRPPAEHPVPYSNSFEKLRVVSSRSSSAASNLSPEGEDEGEARGLLPSHMLVHLAAQTKKYRCLSQRGVAAQFPEPAIDELRTPPRVYEPPKGDVFRAATPHSDGNAIEDVEEVQRLRELNDQLTSSLTNFVQLRHTFLFQAIRETPQHALFACDYIEQVAAAERLLESAHFSASHPTQLLKVPMTQLRVVPERKDVREFSVATNTSLGSGSTPLVANSAGYPSKVRTPVKPSARYSIQQVLSNSRSPSAMSSQRNGTGPTVFERLYSAPVPRPH